ncbi:MAG TPA: hypothetical protein VK857_13940 [Desulforhopalus sp.]|jgi:hypothetical protein|nr:hypothetical protein [Desulforhopalus sp.]
MTSLQEQFQKIKAKTAELISPEVATDLQQGFAELVEKNLLAQALGVGDQAPAFVLADASGTTFSSSELLENGPLVLLFYRGKW